MSISRARMILPVVLIVATLSTFASNEAIHRDYKKRVLSLPKYSQ